MEGITEETVYRAVQLCARKAGLLIEDYVFLYDDEQDRYSLVLEPAGYGNSLGRAVGMPAELKAEVIQYYRNVSQDAVQPCHMIDNALDRDFFLKLRAGSQWYSTNRDHSDVQKY